MILNDSVISTIKSSIMVILTHAQRAHLSNDKRVEGREVKSSGDSEHQKEECVQINKEGNALLWESIWLPIMYYVLPKY